MLTAATAASHERKQRSSREQTRSNPTSQSLREGVRSQVASLSAALSWASPGGQGRERKIATNKTSRKVLTRDATNTTGVASYRGVVVMFVTHVRCRR